MVTNIDRLHILSLAIFFRLFEPFIKGYYLKKGYWSEGGPSLSIIFFIRVGQKLIGKFSRLLRNQGYPQGNQDYEELSKRIKAGASLSRFGDGEFSIIKARKGSRVYFDTATLDAKKALLEVLNNPVDNHLLGMIHEDVVASQLSFANTLSQFKNFKSLIKGPRMPVLAEYDDDMLALYGNLCNRGGVFEAGLLRNTTYAQHEELWSGKDVLYIIGSLNTLKKYGYTAETLFSKAASVKVIETVTEQALSQYYNDILQKVIMEPKAKSKMIFISQGMAGSVLAYDLARLGYHAIDFGQPFVNYK